MSKQIQLRRGTAAQNDVFTGADGEVTVDTDTHSLRVHDGKTPGGVRVARMADIMPSYVAAQTLTAPTTTEQTYTALADGFFYISFFGCNNVYAYVKINGEYVINVTSPGAGIYWPVNQYIPVRKDDVITYRHSQSSAEAWVCAKFCTPRA